MHDQRRRPRGTTTSSSHVDGSVFTTHDDGHGNVSTATSTPVPDSGGTIDTRINNADGTASDVRSVPDGQGGVTTFTANPDGSHTVQYPDDSFYQEPAADAENAIYVQGQVTDTGIDSQFTDNSGNVTTATTTTSPGNTDVHTEYETPGGHVSSDSYVQPGGGIATETTTPDGQTIVTLSRPKADGTIDTQPIVGTAFNDKGEVVLLRGDGQVYNPTTGQFEAMTEKVLETATKAAPKFLTGQAVTKGSKLLAYQAQNFALAGLLDGSAALVDRSLLVAEYATKFGRFGAPVIAAPVGIYMDIRSGVDPGEAVTSGVVGAGVTVAALAVLGTGFLPGLAAAGIGLGAYYGTKWLYGKIIG